MVKKLREKQKDEEEEEEGELTLHNMEKESKRHRPDPLNKR